MRTRKSIKRKMNEPQHRGTGHYCGECALPCWNKENRDYKGDVFIGRCHWSQFGKIIDGTGVVYTDNNACEHFEGKGGEQ